MPRKSAAVAEKPAESRRKPRAKVFPSRPVEVSPVAIHEGEAYYSEAKSGAWRPATVEDRKALKKGDRVSIADNNWVYTYLHWDTVEAEAVVQFIGYNFRTRIPADKLQVEGTTPKPGKFQVGDRCFHAQQTNTGVIQQLNPSEESALVKFAHEKPVWIGVKGLSPLTPAHVLNPAELQEGDRVKGQTLQGQEYQGEFAGLSMSGMVMLKASDSKKRMLNPETLVRLAEEPNEVEEGDRPVESEEPSVAITYTPEFLIPEESADLFVWSQSLDWQQNTMRMYGKETKLPRLEIMFGDPGCSYRYGSVVLKPEPWPAELQALRERVEAATGCKYQVVIGNLYQDGSHHIGWHSDDSPEMGESPAIASVSLGATRKFDIRNEATKETQSYELSAGDLVFMPSGFQATHKHRIAKTSKQVGVRINWTFRPYPHPQQVVEPKKGDRLDGKSLTGGYHTGVFIEKTSSGLFLIQKEDRTEVIITPDSARILEQLALPIEPEQPAEFPTELALNQIRLDKGLQPRGGLDRDHVQDLTEALQRGEILPPVGIKFDGEVYWLYSGFHRVEAHRMADRNTIAVHISSGDYRDAIIAAAATNTDHGLKRSPATKRRVVSWFLADPEWCQWSDRQIAEATKTSHVFVGKMRRELAESGELPPNVVTFPDTRKFNRNGKTHEMAIAPRPKDPIPTVEELHALFSQIGSVEPAVKGTGFAVQNAIGAPFPLAFKNRIQAWEWWQSHTEQIARLVSGAGDYKPPLEPHPQTEITEEVREGLAEAGLQVFAPSISPEEFNAEMSKPLPTPKLPKGICNLTEIPGGWRVDGLELAAEVYAKLAAIARQHTKDASLKEAIAFLVQSFELAEQPVDEEVEA